MFENIKKLFDVTEEEMIEIIALEEAASARHEASKAKRNALAEIFKTKDSDFVAVILEKKDGTLKSFGVQAE